MDLNTSINRIALIAVFPDLQNDDNFHILSPNTPIYNCIAWAMGYTDRWVDPVIVPGHWWPDGVKRSSEPEALIDAFKAEGFEISDNPLPEEGYRKVVLYKNNEQWTHASRLIAEGVEHSKFGESWDGKHSCDVLCKTGSGLSSYSYGNAYAYMKKPETKALERLPQGSISVNLDLLQKLKKQLKSN